MNKVMLLEIISHHGNEVRHIGRFVDLLHCDIVVGKPLKIQYAKGGYFNHEDVIKVDEDEYGIFVDTTHKKWHFVYCNEYGVPYVNNQQCLSQAIEYCEKQSKNQRWNGLGLNYTQIASWLKELKQRRITKFMEDIQRKGSKK